MLNHYTRRLVRRPLTLIALLACLTLVMPPAPALASGYQLSGHVFYFGSSSGMVVSPDITIYKWNGSSWTFHGIAYADWCGVYNYDAGGPGTYMGIVNNYFHVSGSMWWCGSGPRSESLYIYGSSTAEAVEGAYVDMSIYCS